LNNLIYKFFRLDHFTGKFRGAAHTICNLNNRVTKKIPVLFHGMRNFDSHLIIKALRKEHFNNIKIIPQNTEKYTSFEIGDFIFLDSYQFMSASLNELTENLKNAGDHKFVITKKFFGEMWNENKDLLMKKGVLFYDYLDHFDKFSETELPSMEMFYSKLNYEKISNENYEHAKEVWTKFNCKDIGSYHDIYLKLDVCLLSDIFESFREKSFSTYRLEPLHYFSTPGKCLILISIIH
jgi:hypothetical protein